MRKLVIIINGVGGIGKDTFCEIISRHYNARSVSSVDPIKSIATHGGWSFDDKSPGGRRLLSDLKLAFVRYNDMPNRYIMEEFHKFQLDGHDILFVHIREPEEITKFKNSVSGADCVTLLIKSDLKSPSEYGNISDDNVEGYDYDYVYYNHKPLSEMEGDVLAFFAGITGDICKHNK